VWAPTLRTSHAARSTAPWTSRTSSASPAQPAAAAARAPPARAEPRRPAGRVRHPSTRVGRQCLDVAARALGVQHVHREGRLPRPGDPRDRDQPVQRYVDRHVLQVVDTRRPWTAFRATTVRDVPRTRPRRCRPRRRGGPRRSCRRGPSAGPHRPSPSTLPHDYPRSAPAPRPARH
jgi:hypothetical protein